MVNVVASPAHSQFKLTSPFEILASRSEATGPNEAVIVWLETWEPPSASMTVSSALVIGLTNTTETVSPTKDSPPMSQNHATISPSASVEAEASRVVMASMSGFSVKVKSATGMMLLMTTASLVNGGLWAKPSLRITRTDHDWPTPNQSVDTVVRLLSASTWNPSRNQWIVVVNESSSGSSVVMDNSRGIRAVAFSPMDRTEIVGRVLPMVTDEDWTSSPLIEPSLGVYRAIQTSPRLVSSAEITRLFVNWLCNCPSRYQRTVGLASKSPSKSS